MPDKTIDPNKLRQDLIQTIRSTIESYGNTVKEIRQRELKKKELCLLCGNADGPTTCTCLKKNDGGALDMANSMGGGGPMAMGEKSPACICGQNSRSLNCEMHGATARSLEAGKVARKARGNDNKPDGKKPVNTGFKLTSLKDAKFPKATGYKNPLDKDELSEAPGPKVQGARAVADKKEPGAVLPGDKDPEHDNQPDEGSGGMKKDEYTGTRAATNHGGQCSWCEAKATHHDTTDTRRNKDLACGEHLHHIEEHSAPIALTKGEAAGLLSTRKAFMKRGKTVADLRAAAAHSPSPMEQPKPTAGSTNSIPMGKGEKMDTKTGGRLNAIAGDRMKDVINAPKTKGSMKGKLASMGKKEMAKSAMVPSVQDKVNAVVGNQDPGEVPANVKDAAKDLVGLNDKKKDDKKKPAKEEDSKKPMAKVSVDEANKEMKGFKSIASNPTAMPGTKLVNPQAMSPGKGPKSVSGTIGKNEDRLQSVLGKCAMCSHKEHMGKCETV